MLPFINPWNSYLASGGELPEIDYSSKDDKEFLITQGILISIFIITTIVMIYVGIKWNMFWGLVVPITIIGIISVIYTYEWIKELLKYIKKK